MCHKEYEKGEVDMKIKEKFKKIKEWHKDFQLEIDKDYFGIIFAKNYNDGIQFGITPLWIHKHNKYHFHFLIDFLFYFLEIRIGKEYHEKD